MLPMFLLKSLLTEIPLGKEEIGKEQLFHLITLFFPKIQLANLITDGSNALISPLEFRILSSRPVHTESRVKNADFDPREVWLYIICSLYIVYSLHFPVHPYSISLVSVSVSNSMGNIFFRIQKLTKGYHERRKLGKSTIFIYYNCFQS